MEQTVAPLAADNAVPSVAMELLCCERALPCLCRAYRDPVLLRDARVLANLLRAEERCAPCANYMECVQPELTARMRQLLAEWMLEVCEEQKCQEEVFPLAMNYVDRFLSACAVRKQQLQLLGCACLLLASKLRQPHALPAALLVLYTDNSISLDDLWRWELLVLSKLKWDLCAVTPQDFLAHILCRLTSDLPADTLMVRRHAQTFIALCARDYKFCTYTPSMIAAASIAAALHGLDWTSKSGCSLAELLNRLHCITAIERDYLQGCLDQIEEMVTATMQSRSAPAPAGAGGGTAADGGGTTASSGSRQAEHAGKLHEHGKAGTPTDVRDVHF